MAKHSEWRSRVLFFYRFCTRVQLGVKKSCEYLRAILKGKLNFIQSQHLVNRAKAERARFVTKPLLFAPDCK
ncbi:hypothetical protein HL670_02536 [Serratia plymuthica]|nr:hypothetical protein HL670_02536 [Serratia plymuthica]